MRRVSVTNAQPRMILGRAVYDINGQMPYDLDLSHPERMSKLITEVLL